MNKSKINNATEEPKTSEKKNNDLFEEDFIEQDEIESDGSASAFDGTETVSEDNFDNLSEK